MGYREYKEKILEEISNSVNQMDGSQIEAVVDAIAGAKRIFCDGKGRSGLQTKAFAMRLAQMGLVSYEATEVTTPAISKDDILIIGSGSGETATLVEHARTARKLGAKVILITTNPESTIGKMCDYKFIIPANDKTESTRRSIQPMATLFEQTLEILYDMIVLALMEKLQISNEEMYEKHNNLE